MVKMLVILFFLTFFLNWFNKNLIQLIFQNLISMIFLIWMMIYPLNNLNIWMMMYGYFMIDFYSFALMMLTLWIFILMIMVSENFIFNSINGSVYFNLIMTLMMSLLLCFSVNNMFYFYIFFESSLIPMFMLIMGWGGQSDRIEAALYMMVYTMIGSFPLLMGVIYLQYGMNSLSMDLLMIKNFSFTIYLMMILGFLIKLPMYFVHLWLPKAHVQAPVMGSMVLAGIMLKLGSYGLLRVMVMMTSLCMKFNKFILLIGVMGGVYSSLICLCQIDMKSLVAYSSVVHMSILLGGMMTLFNSGILGGYLMMLAHGMCSSGLFFLVNVNYERLNSRSFYLNKGMINFMPSLSLMWFFLCSCNLSFPPSLNLFSEILLISSMIMWSKKLILILVSLMFFSALYTLYLYTYTQHGKNNLMNFMFINNKMLEFMTLLLHWVPLNIMFIFIYIYL